MQQASWGIQDGDNLEATWIRFNPHLLSNDNNPGDFCFKDRMKVLFSCLIDVMSQPVDPTGPKGPFVYYLFYGVNSKNIDQHFGNNMGIEIKKQINSLTDIDEISQFVLDVDTEFSNINQNDLNAAIDTALDQKVWGSVPRCNACSVQRVNKKRKKLADRCHARAKSVCLIDKTEIGLCPVHYALYVKNKVIDIYTRLPPRSLSSPTRVVSSPTRVVSSPTRVVSSPTRVVSSPTRVLVSSPTRVVSSPKTSRSPPFKRQRNTKFF